MQYGDLNMSDVEHTYVDTNNGWGGTALGAGFGFKLCLLSLKEMNQKILNSCINVMK